MGYALFTASGTFKPSSYGLVTGDTIQLLVVGGGASGEGVTANADAPTASSVAGGTSSFGSILSASGGPVSNGCPAFISHDCPLISIGGDGEHGMLVPAGYLPYALMDTTMTYVEFAAAWTDLKDKYIEFVNGGRMHLAYNGKAYANSGSGYYAAVASAGRGGLGYGAGGGGGAKAYRMLNNASYAGKGGAAGNKAVGSYVLPNANNIAVTVGNGGVALATNTSGGNGAPGCVAVFW